MTLRRFGVLVSVFELTQSRLTMDDMATVWVSRFPDWPQYTPDSYRVHVKPSVVAHAVLLWVEERPVKELP